MKRLAKEERYTEEELKDLYFMKNPVLEYTRKGGIVTVAYPQQHPIQQFFRKLHFHIPQKRYLELDPYGSFVFSECNGQRSVYDIGRHLANRFPEADEYRYSRLLVYLNRIEETDHLVVRCQK